MRQTTRVEVVSAGAKWNVTEHGIGRLSSYRTKAAAEAAARALAAQHPPAELIIRNQNGSIEAQHSYPAPSRQTSSGNK